MDRFEEMRNFIGVVDAGSITRAADVTHIAKSAISRRKSPKKSPTVVTRRNPPDGWDDIYSLVEELRQDRTAPVDDSGSEALPDKNASPKEYRFQLLICLMLSSQTKDAVVGERGESI